MTVSRCHRTSIPFFPLGHLKPGWARPWILTYLMTSVGSLMRILFNLLMKGMEVEEHFHVQHAYEAQSDRSHFKRNYYITSYFSRKGCLGGNGESISLKICKVSFPSLHDFRPDVGNIRPGCVVVNGNNFSVRSRFNTSFDVYLCNINNLYFTCRVHRLPPVTPLQR